MCLCPWRGAESQEGNSTTVLSKTEKVSESGFHTTLRYEYEFMRRALVDENTAELSQGECIGRDRGSRPSGRS